MPLHQILLLSLNILLVNLIECNHFSLIVFFCSIIMNENITNGQGKEAFLVISSMGHAALVYVNKKLVGRHSFRCNMNCLPILFYFELYID